MFSSIRIVWVTLLAALLLTSCVKSHTVVRRKLTGTCDGACRYYLACKGSDEQRLYLACVSECGEVFSDRTSLEAFESLRCSDLIAFIEGANGREPGSKIHVPAPE